MATARYCTNGHYNGVVSGQFGPSGKQPFCTACGRSNIEGCPDCQTPFAFDFPGAPPSYCGGCGKPLPWTVQALQAADEFTDLQQSLSIEEKDQLKKSISELTRDTPQTTVAAHRFKALATKAGKSAVDGFRTILISVATEAAKKVMFPGP